MASYSIRNAVFNARTAYMWQTIRMEITGLHLLLTYQCNFECDHCFVWGSERQTGTMTSRDIELILDQAMETGTVKWIYFEGGEPFLYHDTLLSGVQAAAAAGFKTGIVTNAKWADSEEQTQRLLRPFAGLVQDLSISSDAYHWSEHYKDHINRARAAAERLAIPTDLISISQAGDANSKQSSGQIPAGESAVVFRGRAAAKLACHARLHPWEQYTECPFEDLREPGRVHLDPLGSVHICQGISIGNFFKQRLREIFAGYDPDAHPVTGPLLRGGPAELARANGITCRPGYADACHLCYETRRHLRQRYPEVLAPDQVYGVI